MAEYIIDQPNTSTVNSNTPTRKAVIDKIIQLLTQYEITIPELVDYLAKEDEHDQTI
ncbi:MAG TPA: hypothetical protein IAC82_09165 [Candidatus Merdivicinus intestinigallinarum]|nr:hypothetical protein [Candidatus Merdivicinus intestinigallinarum]